MGLLGPQAHRAIGKHALFYTFGFDPRVKTTVAFHPVSGIQPTRNASAGNTRIGADTTFNGARSALPLSILIFPS